MQVARHWLQLVFPNFLYACHLVDELRLQVHFNSQEMKYEYLPTSWPVPNEYVRSYLHYMPTNMTYCNTTRASHLAEDERLRAFQGHLKKLSKHGFFSMARLLVQCSCADFYNLGRYGFARLYVSVLPPLFVISMLICSFYALLVHLCSFCPHRNCW